jgi:hypothetical protein
LAEHLQIGPVTSSGRSSEMEAEMAHTEIRTGNRAWWRSGVALKITARMAAALRAWLRRRAIADLTPDQLKDIGHPEADAPKPTLDVEAGLITNLMSMR